MNPNIKICGLKDAASLQAAVEFGARYVGFVFFPPSPRSISPADLAPLTKQVPPAVIPVGLFVDPSDDELEAVFSQAALGMIQLHGKEPPSRLMAIKERYGLPVMKALPVATKDDLIVVRLYEQVADWLLFDARPAPDAILPGGNAQSFDWSLMRGLDTRRPWMLAGGLNHTNIADAVRISGARNIDVSSGVESAPGVKDIGKIKEFLQLSRAIPA